MQFQFFLQIYVNPSSPPPHPPPNKINPPQQYNPHNQNKNF